MKRKLNIIAGALMMTAFICVPMLSGCSKTKSVSTEITVEKAAKRVKQFQKTEPLRLKRRQKKAN